VTKLSRTSGIQLHLTSLPGGRLGPEAYRFADWLVEAGQSWWQVLPLGPPDRFRSPYKSKSAFAAWPGLLERPDAPVSLDEIDAFRTKNAFWIDDWGRLAGGRRAIEDQVRFDREWAALRAYCAERGIRLLGDVAIYVAPGSVDQRAHPELFQDGFVAGAPPDAFSDDGQLWGNPLYDWPALRRRRYRWWVERARRILSLFDVARIDHFRGFVAYWSVPETASTAVDGRWVRGPGRAVFDAIAAGLGEDGAGRGARPLPFVAEDLGVITPPVDRLRDALGFPGMVVLQFGFEPDEPRSVHRLANHVVNRFVYTGTHDHDTARGWWEGLDEPRQDLVRGELRAAGLADAVSLDREPWWALIRLALSSPGRVAMMQMQDVLGLGSEARMNNPGRQGSNWRWQLEAGALTPALARRLRDATEEAGRLS
jgi:4-alpha-glucanotransferase